MSSSNKSNFNQAFWLGISSVSSILVSLVSAAILSRFFDKAEYGTYKQVIFVYSTLLVIFEAGLPSVFSYFLPKYTRAEGKYILNKINQLLFISGALLSITLFFSADFIADFLNNNELAIGLKIFSPFPFFTLPTLGLEGIYIVNKNTKFVAVYNTLTRLLMLSCIVLPVVFYENSYKIAIVGWGIASFFAFLIALYFKTKPYKDIECEVKIPNISRKIFKYSLPILGSSCVLLFYNSINQILISHNFGVETFAEFSNGFLPLPFIMIVVNPIRKILIPLFSKAKSENNLQEGISFFNKSVYELGLIIIPLSVFCFCFAKQIMIFLYGEQYVSSAIYFQLNLVFNICEIVPLQVVLFGLGKTKILFIFDFICTIILLVINLGLLYVGIDSPIAVAVVFVLMQIILRSICPYLYLRYKGEMDILSFKTLVKIFGMSLHVVLIAIFIIWVSNFYDGISILLQLIISGLLYYVFLLFSGSLFHFNYLSSLKRLIRK